MDDFIKIVFVKSCDNDADLFTKNVSKDTYTKHMNNFLGKWKIRTSEYWRKVGYWFASPIFLWIGLVYLSYVSWRY